MRDIDPDVAAYEEANNRCMELLEHIEELNNEIRILTIENAELRRYAAEVVDLSARVEELEKELREEHAVCLCGCPLVDHETYDDGIACDHEDHECMLAPLGIAAAFADLRTQLAEAKDALAATRSAFEVLEKALREQEVRKCPACAKRMRQLEEYGS